MASVSFVFVFRAVLQHSDGVGFSEAPLSAVTPDLYSAPVLVQNTQGQIVDPRTVCVDPPNVTPQNPERTGVSSDQTLMHTHAEKHTRVCAMKCIIQHTAHVLRPKLLINCYVVSCTHAKNVDNR